MSRRDLTLFNECLRHIKDVYQLHPEEIESFADFQGRWDRLVEINVTEQVQNLAKLSLIQRLMAAPPETDAARLGVRSAHRVFERTRDDVARQQEQRYLRVSMENGKN